MIGIVGATGAVGKAAAQALHRWGITALRLGGRRQDALTALAATLPGSHTQQADVFDPASLAAFCTGCDVIVNCAGPAHEVGDRVARAAAAVGAAYADAAGDDVLYQQVARIRPGTAMISAGMMPGLTSLLPRYLAQLTTGQPHTLTAYIGGRDKFTLTAAEDYFRGGTAFGAVRTVLRNGKRAPATAPPPDTLPFFAEPAFSMAFLSTETERVCARLGVTNAATYSVFAGEHVGAVMRGNADAHALTRAAALDSFGRATYQLIVIELATATQTKTLVLRGNGASELTGAVAALAAHALASKRVPDGVHHAGEILDPAEAVARLTSLPTIDDLSILDGSAQETGSYVEEAV
ncbi:saccharopine dehydrogenase NADP-binding domain-containing protein [Catelliglobosispora koreensis]|uniref:saccharopine dehydrogenase NADP-binding domain-containing protein n=1 Tax=Catelliglobosispora koreensis TaxID=129052 RepID=UPI00039A5CE0|nr:saccharopine dehydrogenase NADP-binding domain-containing protein [Catelliglobosispora koreensis]